MTSATVGEALAPLLAGYGVDTAFGIPGDHTVQIYRGLARSTIRYVTPRHEQGAGFMADGYGRITGKPGVCLLISGPGLTNAITPIAQAYHDSQPMLIISSTVSTRDLGRGYGVLHDLPDHRQLMDSVCAFSETVVEAERLPELICQAFELFASGRPRPVHIAIPVDVLAAEAPRLTAVLPNTRRAPLERGAVQEAARLLADSRQPMILLGGGAMDAGDAALAIAEIVGAPVVLSGNANGAVPPDHELCIGCALGDDALLDACSKADVVLAIGTELSSVETLDADRELEINGKLIRIDIDPGQLHRPLEAQAAICGDSRQALGALLGELGDARVDAASAGSLRARSIRSTIRSRREHDPWTPWVEAIRASVPREAVVALDSTKLAYALQVQLAAHTPRSWLAPYGFGTLGPALPMAVGAKTADSARPVVAIAGDGGALFTITELAASVQHQLPVVLVIWNSSSYEAINDAMLAAGGPSVATELTTVDFVALARSLGCHGLRARTPEELHGALATALTTGVTTVIDTVNRAP